MITAGLVLALLIVWLAWCIAACGRGDRIPGPSWYDLPRPLNRGARRRVRGNR